jgi:uncharacterized protein YoxC
MSEENRSPPGAFGVDALTRAFNTLAHTVETLAHNVQEQTAVLKRLEGAVKNIATRQEFDAAKMALGQAISDAVTRVTADIQALRDQLANGTQITDQDLADIQDDMNKVGNLDPAVVPPPTK